MMAMHRCFRVLVVGVAVVVAQITFAASATNWQMEAFDPNLEDAPSLQRGANLYINFCLGCHSLKFQRYERTADDLGIPHELALENLVFTGQKIGELMTTSMPAEKAKEWFGAPPPDLTMVARVRGAEWIYNYLHTFYVDETRPFGMNNKVFPNVGMPHALLPLQGTPRQLCDGYAAVDLLQGRAVIGAEREPRCSEISVDPGTGTLSSDDYDQAVRDITNFLYYVGEPSRLDRYAIGKWVIAFLFVLFFLSFLLNREYWKDIH